MIKRRNIRVPSLDELESAREELGKRARFFRTLRSTIAVLLVAAAAAVLVATLWMPVLEIYGYSMSPTLTAGDIVVSVKTGEFRTGEPVAFYFGNKLLVKRVICGPGDWVDIAEDGTVSVNGHVLQEDYITEKALGECDLEFPYQVPEGKWFLIGDNRSESVDSRSSRVGCIEEEQIVGRIIFRVWPLTKIGRIG